MPRGSDQDSWYDEGEFPPVSSSDGQTGAVAAAVLSFLMSAFNALVACCFLVCGAFSTALMEANRREGGFLPQDMVQYFTVGVVVLGLFSAVAFALQILAGFGLLRGRRWARTLTFFLSAYALLVAAGLGYVIVQAFVRESVNEDSMGMVILGLMLLVFHVGYGLSEFIVLLNPGVARRLR